MPKLHPKVKVPAVVGTVITIALAVTSGLTSIPAAAPYVAAAVTTLQTISGYFTYAD